MEVLVLPFYALSWLLAFDAAVRGAFKEFKLGFHRWVQSSSIYQLP